MPVARPIEIGSRPSHEQETQVQPSDSKSRLVHDKSRLELEGNFGLMLAPMASEDAKRETTVSLLDNVPSNSYFR